MTGVSPGELIDGRYKVISRLGAGGMADVFLAEDEQLKRNVALKLLHRRFAEDPGFVERFRREAQAAASLQHPHVVSVFDRGVFDDTYYIAMEYLPGRSLKALIRQEAPLDPIRAIDITVQILKAARFAHRRGVIHRDLKPHNVIVDESDQAKVTDFGIARAGASDMTETGSIMGTAQYLSPEQAQGHAVSEASDLYSVGIVLYELLTGRVPFDAESAVTIALKHVSEAPVPPSRINPQVPEPLEQVVLWALNKRPEDRPASADQFITVLEQVRELLLAGGAQRTASMAVVVAGTGGAALAGAGLAGAGVAGPATGATDPGSGVAGYGAYAAVPPPAIDAEPRTVRYGEGEPPPDRGGGWGPWPWIVGFLILLLAGGGVAAYLLTRPAKAAVPYVVSLQLSTAETALQNAGFRWETQPETSNEPSGEVIGQSPLARADVRAGSTVYLLVSQGPGDVNVPSVTELPQAQAMHELMRAGLVIDRVLTQTSNSVPSGYAISTSPQAGQSLQKGTGVTLFVSSGHGAVDIPTVTGDTQNAAKSTLSADGFKVTVTTQALTPQNASTLAVGDVISQAPGGGTRAAYGSEVSIVVATAATTAVVPSVIGDTQGGASGLLKSEGFKVLPTSQAVIHQNRDGNVISQSPRSGATVNKGSVVTIVVGKYVGPTKTTTTTTPALNPTTTTTPITTPTTTSTTTPTTTTPTTPTAATTTTTP